jgi:hypothetical protein
MIPRSRFTATSEDPIGWYRHPEAQGFWWSVDDEAGFFFENELHRFT